ncbi:hypothetical protein B0O80DRAFT_421297 [Mortierella sp. GBAus27b]|nr:hypothetical protein BGX31_001472 [Mortierella sp. GBA43]KAI8363581.1 hypothetical protein B0O80DRAFT_421297 [Mortierella sp. GBAus27b]
MASSEQEFRTRHSIDIITIPTRLDSKTGDHIVLWSDIQQYFANAQGVLNNGKAVLFLTDDNFEYLTPLRITHCPGIVLEVVVGDAIRNEQDTIASSTCATTTSRNPSDATSHKETTSQEAQKVTSDSEDHAPSALHGGIVDPAPQREESQPISNARFPEGTHIRRSEVFDDSYSARASRVKELRRSYLEAIKAGHMVQATAIKGAMNELLEKLQATIDKNRDLQDLVVQLQQTMDTNQEENRHQLIEMQQQMEVKQQQVIHLQQQTIQMQQEALDRLAIIQDRVQTLMTQNYELHEYPIPRLFIILPKQTRLRDKILKPFADQFQLYFLCECGSHTMAEGSTTPHEIHMAKHEGYELEKPNEFFEKYGTYVLAVMYMIKYGIMAAGMIVPPLTTLKVVEGLDSTQHHLDQLKRNIAPLVDDSIAFLQDLKSKTSDDNTPTDSLQLDKLEVLEGADLRQLESYLKITDKHRVLGNLYRIVTLEGHVKWVCIDHYRANYRESNSQRLRDVVEVNRGSFKEDLGEIEIKVTSNTLAKQVYDALVKARGIHKLHITLAWDATMSDLRTLTDTVTAANIVDLTIDGSHFEGPTRDVVNRSRRYDPIMRLVSNGRLQTLALINFKDLLQRITQSSLSTASKLRVLELDSPIDVEDANGKTFLEKVLVNCPNLVDLELGTQGQESLIKVMMGIIGASLKLEILKLHHGGRCTTAKIQQGKIETIDMFAPLPRTPNRGDDRLKTSLSHLPNDSATIQESFYGNQMVELLRKSPNLSDIKIFCQNVDPHVYLDPITLTRQAIVSEGGVTALRRMEITYPGIEAVIFVEFGDTKTTMDSSVSTKIIAMRPALLKNCPKLILRYGWSIETLDTQPGDVDDKLAELFDLSTEDKGSKLRSLGVSAQSVSRAGLECVDRIIGRSNQLERLCFSGESLGDISEREKSEWFLARHGKRLTGLHLRGSGTEWLTGWLVESFPTRFSFLNLIDLELRLAWTSTPEIPSFVQWVIAMVSAPPQLISDSAAASTLDLESKEPPDYNSISGMWRPLIRLALHGIKLHHEDWVMVIMAIDFTTLEELDLGGSNFSMQEFDLLVDCIGSSGWIAPDLTLDLSYTRLSTSRDIDQLRTIVELFREKAPFAKLKGLGL